MTRMRTCSSCGTTQPWDELFGFANRLCPEFCKPKFLELLPVDIDAYWVDVDEALPEDYKEVLYCAVTHEGTREIMTGHRENGFWTHCCMFYSTRYLSETVAVTHWMPLPDFPGSE